jgi:CRP-like cAMP-binding protein
VGQDSDLAAAVGRPAARLAASPNNLGHFWELAAALGAAGRADQARAGFEKLGRAASSLGHVALAVACARALDAAGAAEAAAALLDHIAGEHGRGSSKIDRTLRSAPPAPPPAEPSMGGSAVDVPPTLDAAVDLAGRAIRAAAASADARAPDTLAPTALVSVLEPSEVHALCSVMELASVAQGDVVVEVGEPATSLYWIARGSVEVSRSGRFLGELRPNQFFGEIALVGGTTRTARVAAAMPALLLVIPADAVEQAVARQPRLGAVLARHARARLLATVMRTSELFSRLSEEDRSELLPMFDTEMFESGETVVEKGSHNQRLYVVASGRCEVHEAGEVLGQLESGDGIGEVSLLSRRPATFDVVVSERAVLLSLSREKFDEVAVKYPGLLAEVYKLLVQREEQNRALVHDATDLIV